MPHEELIVMARGGARNRSGPQPDPMSGRSDARGLKFDQLPAEGYDGEVPEFGLPGATERELAVWEKLWRTPQAAAWAREPWRHSTVENYARWTVRSEDPEASAAIMAQVHRLGDQLGLTPAGLRENGWVIARDEVTPKRAERSAPSAPTRRLRAVGDGG